MPEELKIRITNYRKVEENLKKKGAKFNHERTAIDTYYKQPPGKILKVMEADKFSALINLKKTKNGFEILKYMHTNHPEELKDELEFKYGIKCVHQKRERLFDFKNLMINIDVIKGIGSFLIIEGNNLSKDFVTKKLGIKKPKFVRKALDDMKNRTKQ